METRTSGLLASTKFNGWIGYNSGSDYNRCVPDAAHLLNRVNGRGEVQGLHYASAGYTPLSGETWHSQSIVRLPYIDWHSTLQGQNFVGDFSHDYGTSVDSDSHLGVAQMGFTGGNAGRAIGTNRSFNDWDAGSDWLTAPNPYDTFVPVNGTPKFKLNEIQNHPGGMSSLGWHVVVPLQKWDSGFFGGNTGSGSVPYVQIFDFWDPVNPVNTHTFESYHPDNATGNDAAALTKLENGRYLLALSKGNAVSAIEFYISVEGMDLDEPGVFGAANRLPDATVPGYTGWPNMNFINDCNGDIFLIGFDGNVGGTTDKIYLRRIAFYGGGTAPHSTYRVEMTLPTTVNPGALNEKNMFCSSNDGSDHCDFKAASGTYVDPDGHVIFYGGAYANYGALYKPASPHFLYPCIYSTPCSDVPQGAPYLVHGNGMPWGGSDQAQTGYLDMVEFHERHGNADPTTACDTIDKGWVELYQNANFNGAVNDSGAYYYFEAEKFLEKPSNNLGANYFNDKTRSLRWCLPPNTTLGLYSAVDWGGSHATLVGNGTVQRISDLNGVSYSYGGGSMNGSISSYWLWEGYTDPNPLVGVVQSDTNN